MAYYKDLREHIAALEKAGQLVRITRQINKDTEMMPLVRCQFRGLPEEERKAFLFENLVDIAGKHYDVPVLVASHAASRAVYATAMNCQPSEITEKWVKARQNQIKPCIVDDAPAQEEVHCGDTLLEHGGLDELPVPISTPGFDNAPYLTAANWISKDPETGIRNIGNYRAMVKSQTRLGIMNVPGKDLRTSWEKCRAQGKPLQAAIAIGAVPAIGLAATIRFPYEVDEYDVSGGIAGEPIPLVKCKTVDIEVPATAEFVIEGVLPTDSIEREGPFGEFTGYTAPEQIGPYMNVTCITHRKNPIYNAFISQFPPSESSTMRHIGQEANILKFLQYDLGMPVVHVALHEASGAAPFCVASMKKTHLSQGWQVLRGIIARSPRHKIIIVVDDDIDPHDADSVNWAISWRVQPNRDIEIVQGIALALDPSLSPPGGKRTAYPVPCGGSALLINATTKWEYPPLSLPKQEYMENARKIWEEIGLPALKLKNPYYGQALGNWSEEYEKEAKLAMEGKSSITGEKLAEQRVKLD